MSIDQLKSELLEKLSESTNEDLLKRVAEIVFSFERNELDKTENMSEAEAQAVQEGINSIRAGRTVPHEEVMKKVKAILGES